MGVADNKSYKDQYHFNDKSHRYDSKFAVTIEGTPSIGGEPDINSTIKENPYIANVEIEKNEIVYKPDLSALFKAAGKRHHKGGTDVYLEPGSFIYSDDRTLAFKEEELELLDLKKPAGKIKAKNSTPAEVLKRNIDIEHYNRLVETVKNPWKDDLAKKSSDKMLGKYINIAGRIAYGQEAIKDFPTGVPLFAEGTAPVYDPVLKEDMNEVKQYAKYGGSIGNPYMQKGGSTPVEGDTKVINGQQWIFQGGKWLLMSGAPISGHVPLEEQEGELETAWVGNVPLPKYAQREEINQTLEQRRTPDIRTNPYQTPTNTEVPDTQQGYKSADWEFTPWQKLSHMNQAYKFASAKRYMPYRSRYNAAYMDPSLLNPEQAIGDARGMANQQLQSLNTLNPILRNAQAQSAYGQLLNTVPGIRSQYDNQNAQIQNQARQFNTQIRNQESQVNMQNDQNYYKESVIGQQNFDNMRTYLRDQYYDNIARDVETNQSLAYNLLTQNNPAWAYDFRTGKFLRTNKSIMDVQTGTSGDTWEAMMKEVKAMTDAGIPPAVISALVRSKTFSQMAPYLGAPPTFGQQRQQKKGGMVNPYK